MAWERGIGLDIGVAEQALVRAPAARRCGAQLVRVRFTLGQRPQLDAALLAAAQEQVATLRAAGLAVVAVVDSDLTVAPQGAGAFADGDPDPLAQAWVEEMVANARTLAAAVGEAVAAWEILPYPNGDPPRIAPARWAALLGQLGPALRAVAPGAVLISGGLVSDETDDGVDYLRAAQFAAAARNLWPASAPPFDAVGLTLRILPDGGASEEAVGAAVRDRVGRLRRLLEQPSERVAAPPIAITGVGWSAARAGEAVQARNLWTALDALTSDPAVRLVIWSQLQDSGDQTNGLCHETDLEARRPAWQAFGDFAQYYRQIGAAPTSDWLSEVASGAPAAGPEPVVFPPDAPASTAATATGIAALGHGEQPASVDARDENDPAAPAIHLPADLEPEVFPPAVPEPGLASGVAAAAVDEAVVEELPDADEAAGAPGAAEVLAAGVVGMAATTAVSRPEKGDPESPAETLVGADEPAEAVAMADSAGAEAAATAATAAVATAIGMAAPTAADGEWILLRIPTAEALLRAQGLDGPELAAALAALARQYGDVDRLPPGEYRVSMTMPAPLATDRTYTNQQVISALYRAGGGSWSLFERTGLVLGDLAAHRNEHYQGPPLETLGELSPSQRQAVAEELRQLDG